jgi:hypothetical protein
MKGNNDAADHPAAHDALHALVLKWAEATYNEPREHTVPMATTNPDDVIRSQLTEKTGTHFLDSGFDNGRHWQQNQENPPWVDAAMDISAERRDATQGWATKNVYHFMHGTYDRDRTCVALEVCLWALADGTPMLGDMEELAELEAYSPRDIANELDVPREIAEDAFGVLSRERDQPTFTWNTYNHEHGSLSQCIQGTAFGGPYADYGMIQVHQGADVRGSYTAPRVYRTDYGHWTPMEFEFSCDRCDWTGLEPSLYGHDELLYLETVDGPSLEDALADAGIWVGPYPESFEEALDEARELNDDGSYDGAVFHLCGRGEIGFCHVH